MDELEISVIRQCQTGDLEQFGRLYDRYIRKIYDFVYFKTSHKETAEDLTSQIFMKAVEKIKDFQLGRGTFQAWLYQIARNTVIDHYRTKKDDRDIEEAWDVASNDDPDGGIDDRAKLREIERYLHRLKPEQREIVVMRVWQEMSYQEIAAAIGKSEASCKMAYSRAITKLRAEVPLAVVLFLLLQS